MPYFSLVCRQVLRYIAVECCQFIYDMNHPPENKNTNSESLTILIRLIHSLNIKTQLYITALVVIVHNNRGHCGIPLAPSHSLTTLFSSPLLFLFSPPTHSVLFSSLESFSSSLVLFLFLFFSIFLISFFFSLISCYFPSLTVIVLPAAFRSVATRLAHDGGWPDLDLVQLRALGQLQRFCTSLLCSYSTISQ